ncbi:hypothetical protein GGX14DRAFT_483550 [Mycena pura]|uniref:Uncharacterized protein n=1 Tax=Mycena pura TaxID=153505 RepID=A0AAD6UM87_9AGAR|nr:hypothetical protein GGX14DRAFT_483550 [Mycena pura]
MAFNHSARIWAPGESFIRYLGTGGSRLRLHMTVRRQGRSHSVPGDILWVPGVFGFWGIILGFGGSWVLGDKMAFNHSTRIWVLGESFIRYLGTGGSKLRLYMTVRRQGRSHSRSSGATFWDLGDMRCEFVPQQTQFRFFGQLSLTLGSGGFCEFALMAPHRFWDLRGF